MPASPEEILAGLRAVAPARRLAHERLEELGLAVNALAAWSAKIPTITSTITARRSCLDTMAERMRSVAQVATALGWAFTDLAQRTEDAGRYMAVVDEWADDNPDAFLRMAGILLDVELGDAP
jgi:hypothetical protein